MWNQPSLSGGGGGGGGGGDVTAVTATSPITVTSSGGPVPNVAASSTGSDWESRVRGGLAAATADVAFNSRNLTTVGNVDGRDVSADGAALDALTPIARFFLEGDGYNGTDSAVTGALTEGLTRYINATLTGTVTPVASSWGMAIMWSGTLNLNGQTMHANGFGSATPGGGGGGAQNGGVGTAGSNQSVNFSNIAVAGALTGGTAGTAGPVATVGGTGGNAGGTAGTCQGGVGGGGGGGGGAAATNAGGAGGAGGNQSAGVRNNYRAAKATYQPWSLVTNTVVSTEIVPGSGATRGGGGGGGGQGGGNGGAGGASTGAPSGGGLVWGQGDTTSGTGTISADGVNGTNGSTGSNGGTTAGGGGGGGGTGGGGGGVVRFIVDVMGGSVTLQANGGTAGSGGGGGTAGAGAGAGGPGGNGIAGGAGIIVNTAL